MSEGWRPDGSPFWGESLEVETAADVAGSALASVAAPGSPSMVIRYRENSAVGGHIAPKPTLSSGDAISVQITPDPVYLMEGDEAVLSWVVEVLGGSGSLTLAEGVMAGVDLDGDPLPAAPSVTLGARAVAGPGTYVWESTFDGAAVLAAEGYTDLLSAVITCTDGSMQVQQVKLRVWPPGGPVGGYSGVIDDGDTRDRVDAVGTDVVTVGASSGDVPESTDLAEVWGWAWDAAISAWVPPTYDAEVLPNPLPWVGAGYDVNAGVNIGDPEPRPISAEVQIWGTWVYLLANYRGSARGWVGDLDVEEYVSIIASPYEVYWDDWAWDNPTAPSTLSWEPGTLTLYGLPDPVGLGSVTVSVWDVSGEGSSAHPPMPHYHYPEAVKHWGAVSGSSLGSYSIPMTEISSSAVPFAVPDGVRAVLIVMSPPHLAVPEVHGESSFGGSFDAGGRGNAAASGDWAPPPVAVLTRTHYAPFRYWDPTATTAEPPVLRWWPRNDGIRATSPARRGQMSSYQSGRGGGYQ